MLIEDRTKVVDVVFKHPDMVASNAKSLVIKEFNDIQEMEHNLAELRMKAIELEKELKDRQQKFRELGNTFTLVYAEKEIDYKTEECNMVISNSSDARYASYGQ